MSKDIVFDVDGGTLAGVDHGGSGQPTLLVHGSGHNAAAWDAVVPRLRSDHRVVAVDLRGHGHSTAESVTADQYWRDLAVVVTALGWERPLLVGHSTGGFAVTAVVAAGLVDAAGIGVVDGLVLDDRPTAARTLARARSPESLAGLRQTFGYGRRFAAHERAFWIEEQVAAAPGDWLNDGADPALVRAVATRSLADDRAHQPGPVNGDGDGSVRRPTLAEIAATTRADEEAAIFPGIDVYERITAPLAILLPDRGFYAGRSGEVAAIVAAAPHRRLVTVPGAGHNVVMTHPEAVAGFIRQVPSCGS